MKHTPHGAKVHAEIKKNISKFKNSKATKNGLLDIDKGWFEMKYEGKDAATNGSFWNSEDISKAE